MTSPPSDSSDQTPRPAEAARPGDSAKPPGIEGTTADPVPPACAGSSASVLDGLSAEEIEAMMKDVERPAAPAAQGLYLGRITEVLGEDVFVDLGPHGKGTVPVAEFGRDDPPAPGREIHVMIQQFDPAGGYMLLSKKKADRELAWQGLREREIVEGRVTAMNKGGLEVNIRGIRAFMPASQCDVHRMRDISVLLSQDVRVEVLEVNRSKGEVVVSRRNALIRDREAARRRTLDEIREGDVRQGVVGNLTEYGAFVNIGGVDGLLHISDMSWGRVPRPEEVVRPGQEIQVKVLKVDRARGKVSLGLKQLVPNPWEDADARYTPGMRVRGRVTRLAEFGAFVELEPGLEGLIPLSEMSWSRNVRQPSDLLQEGQTVEPVVLSIDKAKCRLSLGLKQTTEDPWANIAQRYPKDAVVTGKVTRLAEFGAFVELEPGIEGLVHISEMSERRIRKPDEVVQAGSEVKVRVLNVDTDKRRLSLSLRPPPKPAPKGPEPAAREKAKRKRPLRGGLASHFEWAGDSKIRL